jgi:ATP-binding cassette subfamily C protein CydCD
VIAGAFAGQDLGQLRVPLATLLVVVCVRAALAWAAELAAGRASTLAKQQLRAALMQRLGAIAPARVGAERTGEVTTLVTRGVDALDAYFALYPPAGPSG